MWNIRGIWRVVGVGGYYEQYTLYNCLKLSKNKKYYLKITTKRSSCKQEARKATIRVVWICVTRIHFLVLR